MQAERGHESGRIPSPFSLATPVFPIRPSCLLLSRPSADVVSQWRLRCLTAVQRQMSELQVRSPIEGKRRVPCRPTIGKSSAPDRPPMKQILALDTVPFRQAPAAFAAARAVFERFLLARLAVLSAFVPARRQDQIGPDSKNGPTHLFRMPEPTPSSTTPPFGGRV